MSDDPEIWTPEEYRALTALTLEKIIEEGGPGPETEVTIAFDFISRPDADAEACLRALKMFRYEGALQDETLVVEIPDVSLSLDAIWQHEERLLTICIARGFVPDGWGFYA